MPGMGWDNLRNLDQGQVVSFNYSKCRTTDDGRFLLPDSVTAVSIKSSRIVEDAKIIDHYQYWKSLDARSINTDVSFELAEFVELSGAYSSDYRTVKEKQIRDRSVTVIAEVRYVRYHVQLQPDTPLSPAFRNWLLDIAAAHEMNDTDQARYLSQLLVRDYGTHVITKADAGAALVQIDQLREEWVKSQLDKSSEIRHSASTSLLKFLNWSYSSESKQEQTAIDNYIGNRTSSYLSAMGGSIVEANTFSREQWTQELDVNMVALDRWGEPLHFRVTKSVLPEVPVDTLNKVTDTVREAEVAFYAYNSVPGCMDKSSPNLNPAANVDDGSCQTPTSNLTFGGVYQSCEGNNRLCVSYRKVR
ncbi:hypothetical protein BaRGS_00036701 [Batillaria attramentaria]|uniref:MACPF domain-containing protein n=1 Tax=Batillaria attramentaria TaxID=370345 RepID=A0ABD0JAS8_9CAEN